MNGSNASDGARTPTGYVALVGNLSEGYEVVGPFATFDVAAAATEFVESWIMPMYASLDGGAHAAQIVPVMPTPPTAVATAFASPSPVPPAPVYTVGNIKVDTGRHEATVNGEPVEMTPRAFAVLAVLARHPGRAFTREQLLALAWSQDAAERVEDRTVDVHMNRLRNAVGKDAIQTVKGVGYRLKGGE